MKITMYSQLARLFLVMAALLASFSINAKVIDNFSTTNLSGWSSTLNGGTINQTNPANAFNVTPAASAGSVTSSKKSQVNGVAADALFTNVLTHTLEFKVLVNSIYTDGTTTNGQAVLGWAPNVGLTTGRLLTNGFSLSVGPQSATIRANTTVLYTTNFVTPIPSTSLAFAMRMTLDPSNTANIIMKSTVYNQADGRYNVQFEYTVTNAASSFGANGGNIALGAVNDASGVATKVSFASLQVFDTVRDVLDDFSGAYPGPTWQNVSAGGSVYANDGSGHLSMTGPATGFTSSGAFDVGTGKTFDISDGTRFEFRLDIVSNNIPDNGNAIVLSYCPNGSSDFSGLNQYHIAISAGQVTAGLAYAGWWDPQFSVTLPPTNLRLIQTFSGEGTTIRIESRVEDLSLDVNDPNRVVYQFMHVDNAGPGGAAVYGNRNGYFGLGIYDSTAGSAANAIVDNAEVNKTPANTPPSFSGLVPPDGTNFYNPAGGLSVKIADDISVDASSIKLTLNGVVYTTNSAGAGLSGPVNNRTFTFSGLALNTFYTGTIYAADNLGASNQVSIQFDTFSQTNLTVEIEDFNYSTNFPVSGGSFFDFGAVDGNGKPANLYGGQDYATDIDYHNGNTGQSGAPAPTDAYRVEPGHQGFEIWNLDDLNPRRDKYVGAVDPAEYVVYSAGSSGDWMNYTRTFPAGTYQVYLRVSTAGISQSLNTLSYVTSDPTTTNQTTSAILGTFIQNGDAAGDTGVDVPRTVPLVDGLGNTVILRFDGSLKTLRMTRQNSSDGIVLLNYMVFVQIPDPGTLRPIVAFTSPTAGSTTRQYPAPESPYASIANRDSSVTNVVSLKLNGGAVAFTTTNTASGMDVGWSFASTPIAPSITSTLVFQDNCTNCGGVNITSTWTYAYPFLRASNRLAGALITRGFRTHLVASSVSAGGNGVATAEAQLAIPPTAGDNSVANWYTNSAQMINWDDNNGPAGGAAAGTPAPTYFPGLDNIAQPTGSGVANNQDHFAVESRGYMYLTAGPHRFSSVSDDASQYTSGTNTTDHSGTVLGTATGAFGFPPRSFDFMVEAEGLYPLRGVYQEGGGYADLHLYWRDPATGTDTCVNDPNDPANNVRVFDPDVVPVLLQSSAAVNGVYATRADASYNSVTRTITVPILPADARQFYRLSSPVSVTITSAKKVGTNIVITY